MLRNIDSRLVKSFQVFSKKLGLSNFTIARILCIVFLIICLLDGCLDLLLQKFSFHTFGTLVLLPGLMIIYIPELLKSERLCKENPQLPNPLTRSMLFQRICSAIALLYMIVAAIFDYHFLEGNKFLHILHLEVPEEERFFRIQYAFQYYYIILPLLFFLFASAGRRPMLLSNRSTC